MYLLSLEATNETVMLLFILTIASSPEKSNFINIAYFCLHLNITGKHTVKLLNVQITQLKRKHNIPNLTHRFNLKNCHRIHSLLTREI